MSNTIDRHTLDELRALLEKVNILLKGSALSSEAKEALRSHELVRKAQQILGVVN